MTALTLTLPDLSCGHCVRVVTEALQRLDPAAQVSVDLTAHRVTVETDAAPLAVSDALRDAGYPPAD